MYKLFLATVIGLAVSLSPFTQAATYGGGSGTQADPYQIWTPVQMNTIGANSADWGKSFKLMADIDMSVYTGTQYNIIGDFTTQFTGSFDGNGYKIRNLTYTTTVELMYVGLFGYANNATLRNLGIENVNISTNGMAVGGLAGRFDNGTITHCYTTGSVASSSLYDSYVGGMVGMTGFSSTTITCCYSTGTASAIASYEAIVGGLVGYHSGTITACYSTASVFAFSSSTISYYSA